MTIGRFLKLAHEQWPTPEKVHHNITLNEPPFELTITIFMGDTWHSFRATETSFRNPERLIRQIDVALECIASTPAVDRAPAS